MMQDLPNNHDALNLAGALGFVKSFRVAVDCGAHRGTWTRPLARVFSQVYALEPNPRNYANLVSDLPPNVFAMNVAVGDRPAVLGMMDGHENTGQAHLASGDDTPVIPLDRLNLTALDFLKIDVEGYELRALEGSRKTLENFRPVVLIEENGLCKRYGIEPGAAGKFLEDMGYSLVARYNKDFVYA